MTQTGAPPGERPHAETAVHAAVGERASRSAILVSARATHGGGAPTGEEITRAAAGSHSAASPTVAASGARGRRVAEFALGWRTRMVASQGGRGEREGRR